MDRYYVCADALLCLASDRPEKAALLDLLAGTRGQIFTSSLSLFRLSSAFDDDSEGLSGFLRILRALLNDVESFSARDVQLALDLMRLHKVSRHVAFEAAIALDRSGGKVISFSQKFDLIPGIHRNRIGNGAD